MVLRLRVVCGGIFAASAVGVGLASALVACGGAEFSSAGSDGGAIVDAGGAAPSDAAVTPFCPNDAYDFCADFDERPLNVEWNKTDTTPGATGVQDNAASISPPNSYLATSPPLAAIDASTQPGAHATLSELSLPKGQTHITFDLRIDELSFPTVSDLASSVVVAAYAQGTGYIVALEFHPVVGDTAPFAAALLEQTTVASSAPTLKASPLPGVLTSVGVWYHVAIDFAIDAASNPLSVPASVSVTSGTPAVTTTKTVTLSPPVGTALGARSLVIGAQATAATGEAKIRFDNVTYKH
jgi:hypothetical protein